MMESPVALRMLRLSSVMCALVQPQLVENKFPRLTNNSRASVNTPAIMRLG